jgi:segregation and condensation protein B
MTDDNEVDRIEEIIDIIETEGFLKRESVEDVIGDNRSEKNLEMSEEEAKASIEAILFAYGEPIALEKVGFVIGFEKDRTRRIMDEIILDYNNNSRRGIFVRNINDSYTLSTKPEMKDVLQRLFLPRNRPPMTQAAYETLSIIAYNQPVTRSQVESVRGVGSDSIIARLIEKNMIRECGTLDAPGRPALFETTDNFLKEFGLSSVHELPPIDMMMYGTLRDIESSIEDANKKQSDNQITIDQIVDNVMPKNHLEVTSFDKIDETDVKDDGESLNSDEIVELSNAFFGSNEE